MAETHVGNDTSAVSNDAVNVAGSSLGDIAEIFHKKSFHYQRIFILCDDTRDIPNDHIMMIKPDYY